MRQVVEPWQTHAPCPEACTCRFDERVRQTPALSQTGWRESYSNGLVANSRFYSYIMATHTSFSDGESEVPEALLVWMTARDTSRTIIWSK